MESPSEDPARQPAAGAERGSFDWDAIDWDRLARLRARFLEDRSDPRGLADYWSCDADLAAYDAVFAARIGWKWDAVFDELEARDIPITGASVLDYGCGTGIASRRLLRRVAARPQTILLHDRSARAMAFAERRILDVASGIDVRQCPTLPIGDATDNRAGADILLISHVLGELSPRAEAELIDVVTSSDLVIWVEPGSHDVARRLSAIRNGLLDRFDILAPCTHAQSCHALTAGDRDWCHFFATPPGEVFTDSRWVRLGRQLGIDLRALPYSFLVLRSRSAAAPRAANSELARVIGRPMVRAKLARAFVCDAESLRQVTFFKSRAPEIYKRLKRAQPATFIAP